MLEKGIEFGEGKEDDGKEGVDVSVDVSAVVEVRRN